MTKFWSGLRETRRDRQALFPGKGRRFKSGQPHHQFCHVEKQIGNFQLLTVIFDDDLDQSGEFVREKV
jgi:hypothetical protein